MNDDLISRQAAIDVITKYDFSYPEYMERFVTELMDAMKADLTDDIKVLPTAKPEIIFCGDCKYKDDGIDEDGIPFLKCLHGRSYGGTRINEFFSWVERREDG